MAKSKFPLLKISLIVALMGTALLLFLSFELEPSLLSIKEINTKNIDEFVKIQGDIISIQHKKGITLLNLKDNTGEIEIVVFENISIDKSSVEIVGKVSEYYGKLQIEARKIRT